MDKNIQSLFFSKDNIISINKKLLEELKLQNVSIEAKKDILNNLIENMTSVWNSIDKTKINNNNFNNIFGQFNNYSLQNSLKKLKLKYNSNFTGIPVNQPITQPKQINQSTQLPTQSQPTQSHPTQSFTRQPINQQYPNQPINQQYPNQPINQQYPNQKYPNQQSTQSYQSQQFPSSMHQQPSELNQFYSNLTPGLPDAFEDPSVDPSNLKFRRDFDINKGKQVQIPDRAKSIIGGNEKYIRQSEETRRLACNFQPGVDSMFRPIIEDPPDEPSFNNYQYQKGSDVKKQMDDIRFQRDNEAYIPRKPQQNEVPDFLKPKCTSIRTHDEYQSQREIPREQEERQRRQPHKKSMKMGGNTSNEFLSGVDNGGSDLMSLDNFDRPITDDNIEEDTTPFAERLNRLKADRDSVNVQRGNVDFTSENFEDTYDDVEPTNIKDLKNKKKVNFNDENEQLEYESQRRQCDDSRGYKNTRQPEQRDTRQYEQRDNRQYEQPEQINTRQYEQRDTIQNEQKPDNSNINLRELYNNYIKMKKAYENINEENLKLKIELETKPIVQKPKKMTSDEKKEFIEIFNDLKKINEKLADELKIAKHNKLELEKQYKIEIENNKLPPELLDLEKIKKEIQTEFTELTKHKQETEDKIKLLETKKNDAENKIVELENKQLEYQKVIDEYNKLPQVKLYQMEICNENNSSYYTYNFDQLENVYSIKLLNYSIPNNMFNIEEDKNNTFEYQIDDEEIKEITLETGKYTIDELIKGLNKNEFGILFELDEVTQKIIVTSNDIFKIIPSPLSIIVLGFSDNNYSNNTEYKASKMYDLRNDNKVLLYLNNIDNQQPFSILIPNSTCEAVINFEEPITLNKLDILFKYTKGRIHNFYNLEHSVSLQIEVKN